MTLLSVMARMIPIKQVQAGRMSSDDGAEARPERQAGVKKLAVMTAMNSPSLALYVS